MNIPGLSLDAMKCWIIAATASLLARGTWGAISWGTHTGVTKIDEDETAATSAVKVVANTDTAGASAVGTYTIVSVDGDTSSTLFTIGGANNDEVLCKTSPGFDYEKKKKYKVVVQGIDDGTTPVTARVSLTVEIGDIDDHESTIQQTCGSASSDAVSGDVIANVAVCDADVQSAISYIKVTAGSTDAPAFDISASGIVTKSTLAFVDSTVTSYLLVYKAAGDVNTATGTLTVTIGGTCPCLSTSSCSGLTFGHFTMLAALLLLKI